MSKVKIKDGYGNDAISSCDGCHWHSQLDQKDERIKELEEYKKKAIENVNDLVDLYEQEQSKLKEANDLIIKLEQYVPYNGDVWVQDMCKAYQAKYKGE